MICRAVLAVLLPLGAATAAPCVTDAPECTEKAMVGGHGRWSLVYRSHPLKHRNEQIRRALIMIHGQGRNADHYFRTAMAAAFLASALEDTIVIAPRIASRDGSCRDQLAEGEISYTCSGNSWRSGATAQDPRNVTSYDFVDQLLRLLANKEVFPNLKSVVAAGHSAGGQYIARYGMSNKVHQELGIAVRYLVANPSSYPYLDGSRLAAGSTCSADGCSGKFIEYREGRNCTTYNQWPYGLESREGYAATLSDDQLKRQLAARPMVYLLGELDTLPLAGFDNSCPAMAQGENRFARGLAYAHYLKQKIQAKPEIVPVPLCGHNARCMFTSDVALGIMFSK